MRVEEYAKYINVLHDLALVEDDLRDTVVNGNQRASAFAAQLLWERFGVTSGW
jgi:hypothetical protein